MLTVDQSNNLAAMDLRKIVRNFRKRTKEIETYLQYNPNEWGRFQNEFNFAVNSVFCEIMNFDKECDAKGASEKVAKLKNIFIKRIRAPFERGEYIKWVIKKPYGYPGDFKYLEDIYENNPKTSGYDRLFDNYTMMSPIAIAVRNRKDDFKRIITEHILQSPNKKLNIMNLGSGPCREVYEMYVENSRLLSGVNFDCYDYDRNSIKFARKRLSNYNQIRFFELNALKLAITKDISKIVHNKYDVIYSTGLFDYFDDKVTLKLISNLKKLLNKNGILLISDVRDKYSNPSLYFMGWVGEWDLVYRGDNEFRNIFMEAGFDKSKIEPRYEQQGILQYIIARY